MHKKAIKGCFLIGKGVFNFSYFFLIALNFVRLDYKKIEAIRRVVVRNSFRFSYNSCQVRPFFFFTKKKNFRMGKGMGVKKSFEYILKPGTVLFKVLSFNKKVSLRAINKALKKISGNFFVFKNY